jgi:hypothetical protein
VARKSSISASQAGDKAEIAMTKQPSTTSSAWDSQETMAAEAVVYMPVLVESGLLAQASTAIRTTCTPPPLDPMSRCGIIMHSVGIATASLEWATSALYHSLTA